MKRMMMAVRATRVHTGRVLLSVPAGTLATRRPDGLWAASTVGEPFVLDSVRDWRNIGAQAARAVRLDLPDAALQ